MFKITTQHPGYIQRHWIKENHLLENHPHLKYYIHKELGPWQGTAHLLGWEIFPICSSGPQIHTQRPAGKLWVSASEIDNKVIFPWPPLTEAELLLKIKKMRYQN